MSFLSIQSDHASEDSLPGGRDSFQPPESRLRLASTDVAIRLVQAGEPVAVACNAPRFLQYDVVNG